VISDNHKHVSFKSEKKSRRYAVASRRASRQISGVNPDWKELCAIATKEVEATLMELPRELRDRAAKLPVTFEPSPNTGLQADGIAADTLGLFTGGEMAEEDAVPMPSQIILFLENLWDFAEGDENVFCDEVQATFLHELGHFLGLNEEDLTDRGLE
jgi:predicted Zn-dependent protease with MMP-like domain